MHPTHEEKTKLAERAAGLLQELGDVLHMLRVYGWSATLTVHGEDSGMTVANVTGELVLRVDPVERCEGTGFVFRAPTQTKKTS